VLTSSPASGRASALRAHAPIPADPRLEERIADRQIKDLASGLDGPIQPLPVLSATGEIMARMTSPEGATHFMFTEMCRAFSPFSFIALAPGPHGPGRGFVGPSGPESPVAKAATGIAHGGLTLSRSPESSAVIIHLGSGHAALGERDAAKLAEMLPKDVPYIGFGVGKRWNQSLM
jgi:hypothetical protein